MNRFDDIVFKNRNRDYGAFHLRRKSASVQIIAMIISVVGFSAFFIGFFIYFHLPEGMDINKPIYYDRSIFSNPYQPDQKLVSHEPAGKKNKQRLKPLISDELIIIDTLINENTNNGEDSTALANGDGNGGTQGDSTFNSNQNFDGDPARKYDLITHIDRPPMFPGGENARIAFLQKNVKYPLFAQKNKIEGPICVTFIVETDSSLTHIEVLQGIGAGCDEEALRLVKAMPKWIPGMKNEKPKRCQITMPIIFTLHTL
jgi:periplasmic protein TonB